MSIDSISANAGSQAAAIQQAQQLSASGAKPNAPEASAMPPTPPGPTVNTNGQTIGAIINVTA